MKVLCVRALCLSALLIGAVHAQAADGERQALGEECYDVLHSRDAVDEVLREKCMSKFRALPVLVVTPTRRAQDVREVPAAVTVITEEEIKRHGADGLAEVLRDVPGIDIVDAGQPGLKRIRIRGEESRRVAILIDGQEFIDQREVGTPLLLAPEMIERVEVVRGSASVLHGSRAIGGVINFITKKGGYHPVQGTVSSSYHTATDGAQLFGSIYGKHKGFSYRVAGALADHDNRETPDGTIDNTSFDKESYSVYLAKHWTQHTLAQHTLALGYDDYNASSDVYVEPKVATSPPFTDFQIDAPKRDRSKVGVFYDGEDFTDVFQNVHLDTYYQQSEREFNTFSELELDFGFGPPVVRDADVFTDSTLETVGGNAQVELHLGEANNLIVGLETKNDDLDQRRRREETDNGVLAPLAPTEIVIDEASQASFELFAQDQWRIFDGFSLTAGARGFWVDSDLDSTTRPGLSPSSNSDSHVVGAAGFSYQGIEDTTLWAGWSQGYVYPTLINLGTGAFAGPNFVNPNPELDPETSNSVDAGLRFKYGKFNFDTSAFYTRAKDYIDHISCRAVTSASCIVPAGRRDRVYVNVDRVQSFGVESAMQFNTEYVSPYVNLAWIRRRFERDEMQTYDTGIPTFSGRFGIEAEYEVSSELFTWADFYVRAATDSDELDTDGEFEHKAGWGTVNLALGADFGPKRGLSFVLEVVNIGDNRYVTATENLPAPGASVIFKIVADV